MGSIDWGILALYYLLGRRSDLEEPGVLYGINWEEQETRDLISFVRLASEELQRREAERTADAWGPMYGPVPTKVRITRGLRVYIGSKELRIRPMAKAVLLLFIKHPEGIQLKCIADYREELAGYYRRVSRSLDKEVIERSITRILDCFSNDLNVNIARVNAAVETLVDNPIPYRIDGAAGEAKHIRLDRSLVVWE